MKFKKITIVFLQIFISFIISLIFYTSLFAIFEQEKNIDKIEEVSCNKGSIFASVNEEICFKNKYLAILSRPPLSTEIERIRIQDTDIINKQECDCLLYKSEKFNAGTDNFVSKVIISNTEKNIKFWFCQPEIKRCIDKT